MARLCLPASDFIRRRGGIVASSSFIRLLSTGCHAGDDEEAWPAPPGHIRSLRRKQQAGWMDKTGTKALRFSVEGQMVLSICPQRQIFHPVRRNRHEPAGFLQRALTDGHFNDRLVVDVHTDAVSRSLQTEHTAYIPPTFQARRQAGFAFCRHWFWWIYRGRRSSG